jgi:predicted transcriptional regulator
VSRLLREAGEALYGPRWQSEMAKAVGVTDRTVRRWVAGADKLPSGVAFDLWRLCEDRMLLLDVVRDRLKEAATPT